MPKYWRNKGNGVTYNIMLPLEQELEVLDYDIERLERRLASTERAPFEWRWTGTAEAWEDMCAGLRARLSVLREEREHLARRVEGE